MGTGALTVIALAVGALFPTGWAAGRAAVDEQDATGVRHGKVTLVAENSAVAPGQRAELGLHFVLEKGWHIYWVNPGDSGEPPKVKWSVPEGYSVGEIEWAAPERLGRGTVVDYGYTGDVTLLAKLNVPSRAQAGSNAFAVADVNWLVCSEICLPEKNTLRIELPVESGAQKNPAEAMLIAQARARQPMPGLKVWDAEALDRGGEYLLRLLTGVQETNATFFPLRAGEIENSAPQKVLKFTGGVRITLVKAANATAAANARKPGNWKANGTLDGVVKFGSGKSYKVSARIRPAPPTN
jgi:DsbC/DsbD-like thiol-disulfide interchange protein